VAEQDKAEEVIYIQKIPAWARVFYFSVLAVVVYALLTRTYQVIDLWNSGFLGRFVMIFGYGQFVLYTFVMLRTRTVYAKTVMYEHTWRRYRKIPYTDVEEVFHWGTGRLHLFLKDSSRVDGWVSPKKLDLVVEAIALARKGEAEKGGSNVK
jgi:hypothetical protein